MGRSENRSSPPYAPLLQVAYGALNTQILCVAAQWELPDRVAEDGPISAAELAPKLGVDALTVQRVLRALVSMDVCNEIDGSRFRLTSLGEYLRPNHPDSVEARVLLHGQVFYPMWDKLTETLRTGESGSQRALGVPLYEHLMKEPQVGSLFDSTMASEGAFRHCPAVQEVSAIAAVSSEVMPSRPYPSA